jgi:hypothetical protein
LKRASFFEAGWAVAKIGYSLKLITFGEFSLPKSVKHTVQFSLALFCVEKLAFKLLFGIKELAEKTSYKKLLKFIS